MPAMALALVCAMVLPAAAQPKGKKPDPAGPTAGDAKGDAKGGPKKDGKPDAKTTAKAGGEKNFDFTGLDLNGRMRTPQLLYFLERANEELERASLEKRSFIPHMVRTVEEEAL
jgi:hypothetical protein